MTVVHPAGIVDIPFSARENELLQFETPGLGDQTYLLRSGDEAAIVDPQRDTDRFTSALTESGAHLVVVAETHIHNDYVSGGAALAGSHGAGYVLPADAGYLGRHRAVHDGDELRVGALRLRAMHTPGHTPHHTSYEVIEEGQVRAVLSGGSVLVGACGRTDLVSPDLTEPLTRQQYASAQRIGALPEPTTIAPTHGAGSFCSASEAAPASWTTVAAERLRNPAFLADDEDDFVRRELAGLPDHPTYYRHMAPINRGGAPPWTPAPPPRLRPAEAERLVAGGAALVDGRGRRQFAAAHTPGAVNVELDPQFSGYLGWLFDIGTRFVVIVGDADDPLEVGLQAARIGLETIEGTISASEWLAGRPVETTPVIGVEELHRRVEDAGVPVVDVRQPVEWREGYVPGAVNLHVVEVAARIGELPGDGPLHVYCTSGHRAAMAASILAAAGREAVLVDGGFPDWLDRGYAVARPG